MIRIIHRFEFFANKCFADCGGADNVIAKFNFFLKNTAVLEYSSIAGHTQKDSPTRGEHLGPHRLDVRNISQTCTRSCTVTCSSNNVSRASQEQKDPPCTCMCAKLLRNNTCHSKYMYLGAGGAHNRISRTYMCDTPGVLTILKNHLFLKKIYIYIYIYIGVFLLMASSGTLN
jgi:hypothetical protein